MKKFVTWCLNHLVLLLGIVTFVVTFTVIGSVMLNSRKAYLEYEKAFIQTDLDVRSMKAAQPTLVEIDDNFKSEYKNELVMSANELEVKTTQTEFLIDDDYIDLTEKGGSISIALELEEKSFVDIDFVLSSGYEQTVEEETVYGAQDLLANVTFIINGETMEDEIVDLPNSGEGQEWHHFIMAGFALPAGPVTVEIQSNSGKSALMPQLQSISFYSSQVLSLPTEEAAE